MGNVIAVYHPIFKDITLNKIFVEPYFKLLKYSPDCSNGIDIVFKHELGHVLTFKNHWLRSRIFSRQTEAAAEIYAIKDSGFDDLIDNFAISVVSHKIAKNLDPTEACQDPNIKKRVHNYFGYFSIDSWNDEKFINDVIKIYPEAKSIVARLGTIKEEKVVDGVRYQVKELLNKLR